MNQGQNTKGSVAMARKICVNPPFMMNLRGCGSATAARFHYLFENMGKWQACIKSLSARSPTQEKKSNNHFFENLTDEEIDE
eukprot:2607929-Alexandrium_andersonii.AAC.1